MTIIAEPSRYQALRELLEERHRIASDQLGVQIAEAAQARGSGTGPGDAADLGAQVVETERIALVTEALQQQVARLQEALERHEANRFGECESCGTAIPVERLQAIPWVVLCVPCQQKADAATNTRRSATGDSAVDATSRTAGPGTPLPGPADREASATAATRRGDLRA